MNRSLVVACLLLFAPPLHAQAPLMPFAEVQPGARVRVGASGLVAGRYVGTVLTRKGDAITVGSPGNTPVLIPFNRMSSLEVSRGKSRMAGAARGVAWGAPIGLAFGVVAVASDDCENCVDNTSEVGIVLFSALSGAIWGAAIGAIVGRERWDSFQLAPRTTLGIQDRGVTLGMRLALP